MATEAFVLDWYKDIVEQLRRGDLEVARVKLAQAPESPVYGDEFVVLRYQIDEYLRGIPEVRWEDIADSYNALVYKIEHAGS